MLKKSADEPRFSDVMKRDMPGYADNEERRVGGVITMILPAICSRVAALSQ